MHIIIDDQDLSVTIRGDFEEFVLDSEIMHLLQFAADLLDQMAEDMDEE